MFAELYVAGLFADAGWQLYFPKRDHGFDFIVTKSVGDLIILRPVQVKGLYPTATKTDKKVYGYSGEITQLHTEMILALPFFPVSREPAPLFTAFLPHSQIRQRRNKLNQFYAFPGSFSQGSPVIRRDFRRFFDSAGLKLAESSEFSSQAPQ
jgi:hypothetical protein